MKLFMRCSLFASLGVFLSVCPSLADGQDPVNFGNGAVGSRYQSIRNAYRFSRFQPEAAQTENAVGDAEEIEPVDGNANAPDSPTPAITGSSNAYHGDPYSDSCGLSGSYFDEDCGCGPAQPCGWFGGGYGLVMRRGNNFGVNLNYDSTAPYTPILRSDDGLNRHESGVDIRIGKYFCGGCYGWEAIYFGVYPEIYEARTDWATLGGGLYTSLGFDNLLYNPGGGVLPVQQMYGNATRTSLYHQLRRSYEFHNVEINFIRNPQRRTGCFNYELIAGFRYFRFNDGFLFSSDYANNTFGDDQANEIHYGIDIDNDLFGFQLGGRADHYVTKCLSFNLGTKFGIYNNHINQAQGIRGGTGYAFESVSGNNNSYRIDSSDDDVAFVGELSTGASYDWGCHWRFTGGYRVLSACGVATADGQIPRARDFAVISTAIRSDECLLLHGAYLGVEYNW